MSALLVLYGATAKHVGWDLNDGHAAAVVAEEGDNVGLCAVIDVLCIPG